LLSGEVAEILPQIALTAEDIAKNKILSCCCAPKTDIEIDAEDLSRLKGIETKTLPARVNNLTKHSEHIIEVELRLPPTAQLAYVEGQYIDILAAGVKRSYSIANASTQGSLSFFMKRVQDGVMSNYWFDAAKENDLLRIEGPKGTFFFRGRKKHAVFLATGTGIAPVKSILDQLSNDYSSNMQEKTLTVYWGNRFEEDFFWQPEYANLNVRFVPVLSRPHKDWLGKSGYIQQVMMEEVQSLNDVEVYACGSLDMIHASSELLCSQGLDEQDFYADAFVSS